MKSPITGQEMPLKSRIVEATYKGSKYKINQYYYQCTDTNSEFMDEVTLDLNLNLLRGRYKTRLILIATILANISLIAHVSIRPLNEAGAHPTITLILYLIGSISALIGVFHLALVLWFLRKG